MTRAKLRSWGPGLAVVLVLLILLSGVYMRARYHSFNWFEPPPRIDVAGRTYEQPRPFTRTQILEDSVLPDGRERVGVAFTRIGWLPPGYSIYAFGDKGDTATRVYLGWWGGFYEYGMLGGP
ncbi:hypothetical protein ABH922_001864 [Rhodococcus sp. 27YEA15]|uniref:hypothetical protein n=1 Tax=Rhodococcus sp. 27YEA15 TaxID=3156259 RepID=UPI003C7DBC92